MTEGDRSEHSAPDVPLPELVGSWLAEVRSEVSPETLRTWELYAGAHFIPHFESSDRLCSERCLRDYMRKRLPEMKAQTVQKELSALRRLFTWMAERGLVHEAPAVPRLPRRATGTAHPSGRQKRIDLSPKEMDAIVCALPRGRGTDNLFGPISRSCEKPDFAQGHCSDSALQTTIDRDLSSFGFGPRRTRLGTRARFRHARRRAAESVLLGHIESGFEVPLIGDPANSPTSRQCEEQDSNLHALRTLEPKSSASANSATLARVVAPER